MTEDKMELAEKFNLSQKSSLLLLSMSKISTYTYYRFPLDREDVPYCS